MTTPEIKCSNSWIKRFFCKPEQWRQMEQGPITINDFRYEIIPVKIEGTYIREQNQKGEDRYIITEPDGTTYTKDASCISKTENYDKQ